MKQVLLCAAIALTAALLSSGAAAAAAPASPAERDAGYTETAPVHHSEGHHGGWHHDGRGWHE